MVLTVQAGRTKKTLIARDSTTQRVALSGDDSAGGSSTWSPSDDQTLQESAGVCATQAWRCRRNEPNCLLADKIFESIKVVSSIHVRYHIRSLTALAVALQCMPMHLLGTHLVYRISYPPHLSSISAQLAHLISSHHEPVKLLSS